MEIRSYIHLVSVEWTWVTKGVGKHNTFGIMGRVEGR